MPDDIEGGPSYDPNAPTQPRIPLLPWDDLKAVNPPNFWPSILYQFMPTLSVLIGQAGSKTKVLQADGAGRLLAAGPVAPVMTVLQNIPPTGAVIFADTTAGFVVGDYGFFVRASGATALDDAYVYKIYNITGSKVSFTPGIPATSSYLAGDTFTKLPRFYQPNLVPLKGTATWLQSVPAAGAKASVTFGVPNGMTAYIVGANFVVVSTAATATTLSPIVNDSAVGNVWQDVIALPATVQSLGRKEMPDWWFQIVGAAGKNVTVGFNVAPPAGISEIVTVGYLLA